MCEEVELIPGNTKRPLKRNGCWVTLWFGRYGELEVGKHLVLIVLRWCVWCTIVWHSTAERKLWQKKLKLVCLLWELCLPIKTILFLTPDRRIVPAPYNWWRDWSLVELTNEANDQSLIIKPSLLQFTSDGCGNRNRSWETISIKNF